MSYAYDRAAEWVLIDQSRIYGYPFISLLSSIPEPIRSTCTLGGRLVSDHRPGNWTTPDYTIDIETGNHSEMGSSLVTDNELKWGKRAGCVGHGRECR